MNAIRMEWIKLRTARSTWWTLAVALAAVVGIAILIMWNAGRHWAALAPADRASFDPVNTGFAGLAVAQLALAVLGVLVVSGEFSSGLIRTTLAAVPRRPLVVGPRPP